MKEYIEREATFNAVLKLVPKVDDDGYCWVIRGDAATAIDSVPAADVRPVVRGKWKRNERGNYNCSNCKSEHNAVFGFIFCPNCGADMRGNA